MAARTSQESAARFLEAKARREKAEKTAGQRLRQGRDAAARARERALWRYVETYAPRAVGAWYIDVGLDPSEFILGTVGSPPSAVAIDRRCFEPGYTGCRCHKYRNRRWLPACHPPIHLGDR